MIIIIQMISNIIGQHPKFKYIEKTIKKPHLNIDIHILMKNFLKIF